jgi:hypothetical protein
MRAERRLGELLRDMPKNKGGGTGANQHRAASAKKEPAAQQTLSDLNITKKESIPEGLTVSNFARDWWSDWTGARGARDSTARSFLPARCPTNEDF